MRPFLMSVFIGVFRVICGLLLWFQTWLVRGFVGGAAGVFVCFGAGWNLVGYADLARGNFCHSEVRRQFVWLLGIFAGVVADDQGCGFLLCYAPLSFRSDARGNAGDVAP